MELFKAETQQEKKNREERLPVADEKRASLSRRRFIGGAATGLAFTIVPRHVLGGPGFTPPSEMINIAVIGVGGQGIVNIKSLLQLEDARIVAIADPAEEIDYSNFYYKEPGGRAPTLKLLKEFSSKQGRTSLQDCAEYLDFRKMLEQEKSIDAVLVATPDHVHAVAAMSALQLGKPVYCEKPLCHSVYETRRLTEAARNAKVATQMGNFGHSGEGIRLTCEWIWDGSIGPVREVHAWSSDGLEYAYKGRPSETPPVPATLDWDLWLGPAPYRPYHPDYAPFNWRGWWDFGTGALGDMACHNLDPAFWALRLGYPTSVEASSSGGSDETTPYAAVVHYEFPARGSMPPVTLHWYQGGIMPERPEELELGRKMGTDGQGILFVGEKGKILCPGWAGNPRIIPETAMRAYKRPPKTLPRSNGHHRDWLDGCKGIGQPSSNFEVAGPMTEVIMMGVIAIRTGEKLYWDGVNMRCTNLPAANDLVHPIYRAGWTL